VTSIAELNVHLSYMRRELRTLSAASHNMATHDDIRGIKETISKLATRVEVEEKLALLRDEVSRGKPSTLFFNVAKVCAALAVIAASVSLFMQVSEVLTAMKRSANTPTQPSKP
jgi:hypothetical protein